MSSKGSIAAKKRANRACREGRNAARRQREYVPPFLRQYEPMFVPTNESSRLLHELELRDPMPVVIAETDDVVVVADKAWRDRMSDEALELVRRLAQKQEQP